MKKLIVVFLLFATQAFAQSTANQVVPGTMQTSGGFSSFVPLSTTNTLPISVYDSGNHSGYCYTSNGSGSPATFQTCGTLGWNSQYELSPNGIAVVAGGTGNAIGDVLTLNDGCATHSSLVVQNVSSGAVTSWSVGSQGLCSTVPSGTISVLSSSGSGSGSTFSFSNSWIPAPQGALALGTLANNAGNTQIGNEQAIKFGGTESVFIGDKAGASAHTGNFNVAIGHNAAGDGGGCRDTAEFGSSTVVGTDALRNTCGIDQVVGVGASFMKGYTQTGTASNHYGWGTVGVGTGTFVNWNAAVAFPYNTAVGDNACAGASGNQSFSTVTCLGAKTGSALTTATNSILINSGNNGFASTYASGSDVILVSTGQGTLDAPTAGATHYMNINNTLIANMTAPQYSSGFGSGAGNAGGSAAGTVVFIFNVGTGGTASSGVINMGNAAPNGWYCTARDLTNPALYTEDVSPTSTTTVTVKNYSRTTGLLTAWTSGDQIQGSCWGY